MTEDLSRLLAPTAPSPAQFEKYMGRALNKVIAKKPSSLPIVKLLLDHGAKAFFGATPLHLAAFNNNLEVAKFLLEEEGIQPNTTDNNGETAFFWTAKCGHADIAEMLMHHGANPCLGRTDNTTPLHIVDHYRMGGKLGTEEAIGHTNYIKFYEPRLNALKTQLRAETIARGKSEGHPSDKPVFIVSMP